MTAWVERIKIDENQMEHTDSMTFDFSPEHFRPTRTQKAAAPMTCTQVHNQQRNPSDWKKKCLNTLNCRTALCSKNKYDVYRVLTKNWHCDGVSECNRREQVSPIINIRKPTNETGRNGNGDKIKNANDTKWSHYLSASIDCCTVFLIFMYSSSSLIAFFSYSWMVSARSLLINRGVIVTTFSKIIGTISIPK